MEEVLDNIFQKHPQRNYDNLNHFINVFPYNYKVHHHMLLI